MNIIFRITIFVTFLAAFALMSYYFPIKEYVIIENCNDDHEPNESLSLDLNQFIGRVKKIHSSNLISELLGKNRNLSLAGWIYMKKKIFSSIKSEERLQKSDHHGEYVNGRNFAGKN